MVLQSLWYGVGRVRSEISLSTRKELRDGACYAYEGTPALKSACITSMN
jgi:hypothetical protein